MLTSNRKSIWFVIFVHTISPHVSAFWYRWRRGGLTRPPYCGEDPRLFEVDPFRKKSRDERLRSIVKLKKAARLYLWRGEGGMVMILEEA